MIFNALEQYQEGEGKLHKSIPIIRISCVTVNFQTLFKSVLRIFSQRIDRNRIGLQNLRVSKSKVKKDYSRDLS